jgi:hypothetical protein
MRTGIATVPLDTGKCPKWLFERMKRLSRAIIFAIVQAFGTEEVLKRLADPVWFQSLACVIGFDWNSSGATTTTLGALKEGIRGAEDELGIYICGGKGKTSRKTPEEIKMFGITRGFDFYEKLIYASKITAKVDSCLIQAGFQIYHHNFIFTKDGKFAVVQQGMNPELQKARRYHWLSLKIQDFTQEPHTAIVSDIRLKPLNLVAKESKENKMISLELVKESPKTFLNDFKKIAEKSTSINKLSLGFGEEETSLLYQKRLPGFCQMELRDVEFYWHPVLKEKFDLKRLKKIIEKAHFLEPRNFEEFLMVEGVGPKTIRALSLVAEIIYGAKPSYKDPARYSFAHGGKDGTPYYVEREVYDKTIEVIEKAIKKANVSLSEKDKALKRFQNIFLGIAKSPKIG